MVDGINDSQFCMWRTIFAFANADEVISEDEKSFLEKILELVPFSEEQRAVLATDLVDPPDIAESFLKISSQDDRATFFHYARMLAWCDGDFADEEQEILTKLQRTQLESADFIKMMESVRFSFENEEQKNTAMREYRELAEKGRAGVLRALAGKFRRM